MQTKKLFLHVTDTIKEWELKLGTGETDMKLYYPAQSLAILLGLGEGCSREEFDRALMAFCREAEPQLGRITVSGKERVCLDIPREGCRYVAEKIPAPTFLMELLAVMRKKGADIETVRGLFARWAAQEGTHFLEREDAHNGCSGRSLYVLRDAGRFWAGLSPVWQGGLCPDGKGRRDRGLNSRETAGR